MVWIAGAGLLLLLLLGPAGVELIKLRLRRHRQHTYWRRTICPHGYMYATENCRRCPYPLYGYGKRLRKVVG